MLRAINRLRSLKGRLRSVEDKARRGIASVEFAIIAPVFFMMLMGVTEISLVMLVEHLLENATYNSSRTGKTGYIEVGKTQQETVMDALLDRLGGLSPLIEVSKLQITSTSYGDLSQIGQPEQGEESLGTAEQVVVYTVTYPWKVFTPMIGSIIGDENNIIKLSSRIVVRNEPFD